MSKQLETGKIVEGKVKSIAPFGAFVELEGGVQGLVHISEISFGYVKEVSDHIKVGDAVKVRVLSVDVAKKRISLTMRSRQKA